MSIQPESTSQEAAAKMKSHLSDTQAIRTTHQQAKVELAQFSAALGMSVPVSTDKLAYLLEHLVKEQTSADSAMIRDQMVRDGWDRDVSGNESIDLIAQRAVAYLASEKGIALFNFFVKIFARTSGKMFMDESVGES